MAAQLTSGLAHDFSNLLTIILGMQSKLLRMELPDEAGALINATLGAAQRGGGLLNRIADMTGKREHSPLPTDLVGFLGDLETLARSTLPDAVQLEIRNLAGPLHLRLDAGMLQDSLLNLVLNARDACGDAGQITLSVQSVKDTWIEFSVTDTGPGFSEAALVRAFEPFFTTKGGEGSGLGLVMVYDMTKLAGGQVDISNGATGGQVSLRLPLRPADSAVRPGLVLLVEDSPDLRDTVRNAGHSVVEASNVPEAQALLSELPEISMLLSDISLEGGQTGIDLMTGLPPGHCPAYLMTSLPPDDPLYKAATPHAPVLRKPFTASQLSAFLNAGAPS